MSTDRKHITNNVPSVFDGNLTGQEWLRAQELSSLRFCRERLLIAYNNTNAAYKRDRA